MLKNNKLLYILPEMSFTASVGETPKQDYYFVQTFHQINGEFMRDENFIHESLKKLFERVEEAQYTLVLPDFLFTDTIVNVPETDDVKIATYLRDQLLPRIEVSTFSHETRTSVLLQRKTTSKVQLSAFEKELAASLKLAIGNRGVILDEIVPLSWALKAAVSLEPSLTIAQLGERLYLAEHYIGINQTISTPIDDLDVLAETVRTLKGSDPNLQTTYLFTSELVEERLKKFLLKTLPVQQLTEPVEEEAKIPPYVKQIIEVTARTLSLPDFAVPRFSLQVDDLLGQLPTLPVVEPEPQPETSVESLDAPVSEPVAASEPETPVESEPEVKPEIETKPEPTPSEDEVSALTGAAARSLDLEAIAEPEEIAPAPAVAQAEKTETPPAPVTEAPVVTVSAAAPAPAVETPVAPAVPTPPPTPASEPPAASQPVAPAETKPEPAPVSAASLDPKPALSEAPAPAQLATATVEALAGPSEAAQLAPAPERPQLSFMAPKQIGAGEPDKIDEKQSEAPKKDQTAAKNSKKDDKIASDKKLVSKKKGNMSSFIKKLLLFLLIFVIVIALGIGVGVAILAMTGKDIFKSDDLPVPEMSALPTPEPQLEPEPVVEATPEAEPEPEEDLDPADFEVLVVNATGIAGLAGKAKTALETAGFSGVQTGNAKGEYDTDGTFVLMKERNRALIELLEDATDRKMTYDEDYQVEDAAGKYDAVIVLNEE